MFTFIVSPDGCRSITRSEFILGSQWQGQYSSFSFHVLIVIGFEVLMIIIALFALCCGKRYHIIKWVDVLAIAGLWGYKATMMIINYEHMFTQYTAYNVRNSLFAIALPKSIPLCLAS